MDVRGKCTHIYGFLYLLRNGLDVGGGLTDYRVVILQNVIQGQLDSFLRVLDDSLQSVLGVDLDLLSLLLGVCRHVLQVLLEFALQLVQDVTEGRFGGGEADDEECGEDQFHLDSVRRRLYLGRCCLHYIYQLLFVLRTQCLVIIMPCHVVFGKQMRTSVVK